MGVQNEINKALGTTAAAIAVGKGLGELEKKNKLAADKEAESKASKAKADAEKSAAKAREDLTFKEVSQNKIEGQRKAIAGIDEKLKELEPNISALTKKSRYRRGGKEAMAEAKESLEDALFQRRTLLSDKAARYSLLMERKKMLEELKDGKE